MHNPLVPETLEGWSVLHLMYRVRWDRLRDVASGARIAWPRRRFGRWRCRMRVPRPSCRCWGTRRT